MALRLGKSRSNQTVSGKSGGVVVSADQEAASHVTMSSLEAAVEPDRSTFLLNELFQLSVVAPDQDAVEGYVARIITARPAEDGTTAWQEVVPWRELPLPQLSLGAEGEHRFEIQTAPALPTGGPDTARIARLRLPPLFCVARTGRMVSLIRDASLVLWGTEGHARRTTQLAFLTDLLAISLCERAGLSVSSRFWVKEGRVWTGAGLTTSKTEGMKTFRIEPFNYDLWTDRYVIYWQHIAAFTKEHPEDAFDVAKITIATASIYYGYIINNSRKAARGHMLDAHISSKAATHLFCDILAALDIVCRPFHVGPAGDDNWLVEIVIGERSVITDVANGEMHYGPLGSILRSGKPSIPLRLPRFNQTHKGLIASAAAQTQPPLAVSVVAPADRAEA